MLNKRELEMISTLNKMATSINAIFESVNKEHRMNYECYDELNKIIDESNYLQVVNSGMLDKEDR